MKKYLLFLAVICFTHFSFSQNQAAVDSLIRLLKTMTGESSVKSDTLKLNTLNALGRNYLDAGDYSRAMQYVQQALQIPEPGITGPGEQAVMHCYQKGIANSYNITGLIFWNQGNYERALDSYTKSLKIRLKIGDKGGVAASYNNIGLVYSDQGNSAKAMEFFLKCLKIQEEINARKGMSMTYNSIGILYEEQKNYEKAMENFISSLKIQEEINDISGTFTTYNCIGAVYFQQGNYDKALENYSKSLKISEKLANKYGTANAYVNIAGVYAMQKNYDKARDNVLKSLEIRKQTGHKQGIADSYAKLGDLYLMQNNTKKSLEYVTQSLAINKEIGNKQGVNDCYSELVDVYQKQGDYKQAFNYYRLYSDMKDTLFNEQSTKQIAEMSSKYNIQKKEHEIDLLNEDNKLKETQFKSEIKQQTTLRNFFIGGSVLLLLLVIVSVGGYKQKIKSNNLIALKNEEISKQKANISGQTEERQRIAQELHDGIGGTLAAIKLNLTRIHSTGNINDLEPLIDGIGDACKEIRTISHNLSSPALTGSNPFVEVLKNVIQKFEVPGKTDIHFEYFPEDELNRIPMNMQTDIYRIVQELLHNIIKHAGANHIEIGLSRQDAYIYLMVEDNGKGFDVNSLKAGIGLKNLELRVQSLSGEVMIDSKPGRGTAVNIHIPLKLTSNAIA